MDALWGCQGVYMGRFPEFWTRAAVRHRRQQEHCASATSVYAPSV